MTADGCAPLKLTALSGSPPMLVPSVMRACDASTRATADPPASRRASTARCLAPLAKGTERTAPLSVPLLAKRQLARRRAPARRSCAPVGEAMPARDSSQPASSVSARGRAAAKRPASHSTAKPSAISAPAPPRLSRDPGERKTRFLQRGPCRHLPGIVLGAVDGLRIAKIGEDPFGRINDQGLHCSCYATILPWAYAALRDFIMSAPHLSTTRGGCAIPDIRCIPAVQVQVESVRYTPYRHRTTSLALLTRLDGHPTGKRRFDLCALEPVS